VRPAADAVQVVVGTVADLLAGEIRAALAAGPAPAPAAALPPLPAAAAEQVTEADWGGDAAALLAALGGAINVRSVEGAASRILLKVADSAQVDAPALKRAGVRAVAVLPQGATHLVMGPQAVRAAAALRGLIRP
jgi:PTS system N-acetylglucosamine-specific IIC component